MRIVYAHEASASIDRPDAVAAPAYLGQNLPRRGVPPAARDRDLRVSTSPNPVPANPRELQDAVGALADFLAAHRRVTVLTGAGCSTDSGIPDYRDGDGEWKRSPPVQYREFVDDARARRRYWARSMVGWRRFGAARPNAAHRALAGLEPAGTVHHVITQNVDRLHQRAGSRRVTDLHGSLEEAACLACGHRVSRAKVQAWLEDANPRFGYAAAGDAPDGDADLAGADYDAFRVPDCPRCGGVLKPTVVFFGENVPRERVDGAFERLAEAAALLVVGSSLMVFSGYRFVRRAVEAGQPVAILNLGRTRGDGLAALKVEAPCGAVLEGVAETLRGA